MYRCDVLIAGAGPAGTSVAWGLRHSGLQILIMDKAVFPRDKVCAGWITPAVTNALQIDLDDYRSQKNVLQPIHGFRVGQLNGHTIDTKYDTEPVSYGIRRREFDNYLLQRTSARRLLGHPLKSLVRNGDYWLVNNMIKTPLIVGAGGHFCPVARHINSQFNGCEITVRAQEMEFEMSARQLAECQIREEFPHIYFCPDLTGYGWVFRKGDYLNIGMGQEDKRGLPEQVNTFLHSLRAGGEIPADVPDKLMGHAYLLYHHSRRSLYEDGILLTGDAAGLAYPQSGEGIRPAVESGLLAATIILAAQGDYSSRRLRGYVQLLTRRFGRMRKKQMISPKKITGFKQILANKLLTNKWFARNIIIGRWFLHSNDVPLSGE